MRSLAKLIQQKTGSTVEHKNESRRPANAGRRLSDLFIHGLALGERRFFAMPCAMSFALSFAAVYAAKPTTISFLPVPDLQFAV
jgi:hypothetical protein